MLSLTLVLKREALPVANRSRKSAPPSRRNTRQPCLSRPLSPTATKAPLCIARLLRPLAPRASDRAFHTNQPLCTAHFRAPLGIVGNSGRFTPAFFHISKTPQFHSLNLENSPNLQLLVANTLHLYFHFSCLNDGYCYLFSYSSISFPLPRRAALTDLKLQVRRPCRVVAFAATVGCDTPSIFSARLNSPGIQRSTLVFHAHNIADVNTIKKKKR